jgi:hypothetical protein
MSKTDIDFEESYPSILNHPDSTEIILQALHESSDSTIREVFENIDKEVERRIQVLDSEMS